jgi:hypothetical protein
MISRSSTRPRSNLVEYCYRRIPERRESSRCELRNQSLASCQLSCTWKASLDAADPRVQCFIRESSLFTKNLRSSPLSILTASSDRSIKVNSMDKEKRKARNRKYYLKHRKKCKALNCQQSIDRLKKEGQQQTQQTEPKPMLTLKTQSVTIQQQWV